MDRQTKDYRRFYAALKRLPGYGNEEERKASLVSSYTSGRTTHLREMTAREYQMMCKAIEQSQDYLSKRKRQRSIALHLMQQLGIDTGDWERINQFCQNSRISGKPFARLDLAELQVLQKKLRAIGRAGGLKNETERGRSDYYGRHTCWRRSEAAPTTTDGTPAGDGAGSVQNRTEGIVQHITIIDYGTENKQQQQYGGEC